MPFTIALNLQWKKITSSVLVNSSYMRSAASSLIYFYYKNRFAHNSAPRSRLRYHFEFAMFMIFFACNTRQFRRLREANGTTKRTKNNIMWSVDVCSNTISHNSQTQSTLSNETLIYAHKRWEQRFQILILVFEEISATKLATKRQRQQRYTK